MPVFPVVAVAMVIMNHDNEHQKFRFIEVGQSTGFQEMVGGWLKTAELLSRRTPKALLEGDFLARLPDGTVFKEVTFKAAYSSIELALPQWRKHSGRRSAVVLNQEFRVSDGSTYLLSEVSFEQI